MPSASHPLHVGYILKARGRWNRAGEDGCIYTSLTVKGARAEYAKYLRGLGNPEGIRSRELVSIRVRVRPVVDLTDPSASPVSPSSSFLTGNEPEDLEACRSLADVLRSEGYAALLAPSAAAEGERNLVIYIDGPSRNLDLSPAGERIAI